MAEQTEYCSQGCMLHTDMYPRLPQPIPTSFPLQIPHQQYQKVPCGCLSGLLFPCTTLRTMAEPNRIINAAHSFTPGTFLASFLNYNPQSPVELLTMYI